LTSSHSSGRSDANWASATTMSAVPPAETSHCFGFRRVGSLTAMWPRP